MVAPLDDFTIAKYQLIKERYQTEYPLYYQMLLRAYPDTKQGIGKEITKALSEIEKISPLLDKVLAGRASIEEVEKLNESISKVDITQAKFAKLAETSSHFRKAIETIAETAGIPKEDMLVIRKSLEDSRKSLEKDKRRRPGPLEEIRKAAAETKRFGLLRTLGYGGAAWLGVPSIGRVVRGLLETIGSVAGPLQPLIAPTLGLTAGLGYGAWKLGGLAKRGLGRLFGKKISPEAGRPIEETPSVGGVPSPMLPIGVGAPLSRLPIGGGAPSPRLPIGMEVPRPGAFRSLTRRKKEELTDPLFYFFNKRAYRAAWTRDVLKALTGKKVTGGGGVDEGVIGGVIGGTVVSLALLAAKIAALGVTAGGVVWAIFGLTGAIKDMLGAKKGAPPKKPSWWQMITPLGALTWLGTEYYKNPEAVKKAIFGEKVEGVVYPGALETTEVPGTPVLVTPKTRPILETPPGETSEWISGLIDEFIKSQKEVIEAIKNQSQPTPASIPLSRNEIGQRSIDEDPLMDRLSRGEYQR